MSINESIRKFSFFHHKNVTPQNVVVRITPSKGWVSLKLKELWAYRELLYFLVWRDIKVRYKQTILGASWAIIQPFFTMIVFSIFFGKLAKILRTAFLIPYSVTLRWFHELFCKRAQPGINKPCGKCQPFKKGYASRAWPCLLHRCWRVCGFCACLCCTDRHDLLLWYGTNHKCGVAAGVSHACLYDLSWSLPVAFRLVCPVSRCSHTSYLF